MNKQYRSVYAQYLREFIDMKQKLGFKYKTAAVILAKMDRLAEKRGESSSGITRAFAEEWSKKSPNESEQYRYDRIRYLIQFSSYLCDLGIASYLPRLPGYPKNTFIPYIYSHEEIAGIFKACDALRLRQLQMSSCIISMPALVRLLYGTGLRISEALALKDEDVNLKDQYLRVKDCKNGKERIIPISDSLLAVCKDYINYRNQLPLGRCPERFFVRLDGKGCKGGVRTWFKQCLQEAGIPYTGRKHGPRIHDLRHTFAVTSMAGMAEAGIDLYVSLPILSTYLGHQSLGATEHYVRLTASMYPDLIKDVDMLCLDVFPKLHPYEAN